MWMRLWRLSPGLVATSALMLVVLAGTLVGLAVDPRQVTGAPVWLKPAKFAISIAIYTATLAVIFTAIPTWTRTRRIVGAVTVVAMWIEMVAIGGQAWRGQASHFNASTPFDIAVYAVMGIAITVQTFASIAVAVAVWRERFADAALGWALRVGLVVTIAGAFVGGAMTRPTDAQTARLAEQGRVGLTIGSHTVGGDDGGPGLPITGWSTNHGDLRVPHFFGLHAAQVLPLLALGLRGAGLSDRRRLHVVLASSGAYVFLFIAFLALAMQGVPLVSR